MRILKAVKAALAARADKVAKAGILTSLGRQQGCVCLESGFGDQFQPRSYKQLGQNRRFSCQVSLEQGFSQFKIKSLDLVDQCHSEHCTLFMEGANFLIR